MNTLHLLPGESAGDTADIVLCPKALSQLETMLRNVRTHGYAEGSFRQRDGVAYTVVVDLIDKPHSHKEWRERKMGYAYHGHRHVDPDLSKRTIDSQLLAAHLRATRARKGHNQRQAAAELGLSVGFVSYTETSKSQPTPRNLEKLCRYTGKDVSDYDLTPRLKAV